LELKEAEELGSKRTSHARSQEDGKQTGPVLSRTGWPAFSPIKMAYFQTGSDTLNPHIFFPLQVAASIAASIAVSGCRFAGPNDLMLQFRNLGI